MTAKAVGAAAKTRRRWFLAAQVGVPLFVLAWRLLDGPVPFYGWGWEMYS